MSERGREENEKGKGNCSKHSNPPDFERREEYGSGTPREIPPINMGERERMSAGEN